MPFWADDLNARRSGSEWCCKAVHNLNLGISRLLRFLRR
jgi:hypothetical protein